MKKSILSIALLSMLFVLGACSTEPGDNLKGGAKGTGDATIDAGTGDALDQIDSTEGMTQWEIILDGTEGDVSFSSVDNLFLSSDKKTYKQTTVSVYDGTLEGEGEDGEDLVYDNEVAYKSAAEGTLAVTETFKLFTRDQTGKEVEITDKKGYSKLYTQTPTKIKYWDSQDKWTDQEDLRTSYYIVKEDGDTLSMMYADPVDRGSEKPDLSKGYIVYGAIGDKDNTTVYTKK